MAGVPGIFTVTATGLPAPAIGETGALPSGVTFNAGVLSGTPATGSAATYAITFVADNGVGTAAIQSFTLLVTQPTADMDFSGGFAGSAKQLTYNGSAAIRTPVGTSAVAELTDGRGGEAGSLFSTTAKDINTFSTAFTFMLSASPTSADGFTFTIQSSISLSHDGLDLHSGDTFEAILAYDGATLTVTLRDVQTRATATQKYAIDIPAAVGANTAYVGFTGGTGDQSAVQDILRWTFTQGQAAGQPMPPADAFTSFAYVNSFLNAGVSGAVATTLPTFTWSAVAGADHYVLWVSDQSSGAVMQVGLGTVTTWKPSVPLTLGHTFTWWVGTVSASGSTCGTAAKPSTWPRQRRVPTAPSRPRDRPSPGLRWRASTITTCG